MKWTSNFGQVEIFSKKIHECLTLDNYFNIFIFQGLRFISIYFDFDSIIRG